MAVLSLLILEAVSKPVQRDDEAGQMEETPVDVDAVFVANDQAAEVAEPGHRSFDDPTASVPSELAAVDQLAAIASIRGDEVDALGGELPPQGVAVIAKVGDDPDRKPPPDTDVVDGLGQELHLRRRGGVEVAL